MSSGKKERFAKLMPGIAQYVEQTRSEGVVIESAQASGLFAHPVYAFPPSSLDEKNEQLVPELRFLCVMVSRLRTKNNTMLFPSPADMIAAINYLQPIQGLTNPIADIALEIMSAFGDISDEDYANTRLQSAKNVKKFMLSSGADPDQGSPFDLAVDEEEGAEEGELSIDPSAKHTPSVEQARGN